jgi:quercetin dioxygenase-like cupin family protein
MERRTARTRNDEGEAALWVLGEINTIRARGEAYTLLESATPPGGGLPPHVHHAQDEAIYVLEGEYTLMFGDEESRLGPGSFASVPRGTVHALKVAGDRPGRSLTILTPPGPLERFYQEVGVSVADRSTSFAPPEDAPEMEEVVASARRHGTYLLRRPV